MSEDDLQLNSLARFSKKFSNLHLEEHGHCEVPAGCGGVVLRWSNPATGIPLLLRVLSPGTVHLFIDGAPPNSARPFVALGRHILSVEVDAAIPGRAAIMFAAAYDRQATHDLGGDNPLAAVSAADGSWYFRTTPPRDETWRLSDGDMDGWDAMIECPIDEPDPQQAWQTSRTFDLLTKFGARPIGMPAARDHAGAIWIRNAFHVAAGGHR